MSKQIAIIGSGFSGICMGIQLKKAGIDTFKIYEKADRVGGTWRDNSYPGAACDVASHLYSFSFEPNPNWSRMFSPHNEIYDYIVHCVEKYKLGPHIQFQTEITAAHFQEADAEWEIHTSNKQTIKAHILVNGFGPLNRISFPNISGIARFQGTSFHSAQWQHDYDLKDKKVAVIGTGASAIQIVPNIAEQVKELHLFQRTAPWVFPKPDRKIFAFEHTLFKTFPALQRFHRKRIYWRNELLAWGLISKPSILRVIEKAATLYLKRTIKDDYLRQQLTPPFSLGCKRILVSNDYYPTLNQNHVVLHTDGIKEVTKDGILNQKGRETKLDAIIYATGFQASEYPKGFEATGLGGLSLEEQWQQGPEAFLGTTVHQFPNLFFIVGPNTGLGHSSIILMIEAQVNYIVTCIQQLEEKGAKYMDIKKDVQATYNEEIQKKLDGTVWHSGCKSWYITESGKNTTLWPDFTFRFMERMEKMEPENYEWKARGHEVPKS